MKEAMRLENVVKMYSSGTRAINDVSFSINTGECVAIFGAVGSGKTTLARLIAGIERPSVGQVWLFGKQMGEMDKDAAAAFRNRTIGILDRNPVFLTNLSVLENIALPLMIRGEGMGQRNKKAKEHLKAVGLWYAAHARPSQLTRLERHKAAIARMLAARPQILLIDDFAVDLAEIEEIKGDIRAVYNYDEYTVIELTGATQSLICSDRRIRLEHGKIQQEDTK